MTENRDEKRSAVVQRAGHAHFWDRVLSRRKFLGTSAGIGVAAATAGLWLPSLAASTSSTGIPNPIPGTTALPFGNFHFFFPGIGNEVSLITDFKGFVGGADIKGGTGKGPGGAPFRWNADNRFMKGTFRADDGSIRSGAFVFV